MFRKMIETMNIGFDAKRTDALFKQFVVDQSGTIGAREFIHHLFPVAILVNSIKIQTLQRLQINNLMK